MRDEIAEVLKYWADVEALTAPQAENISDSKDWMKVTHVRNSEYPWKNGPRTKIRHAVRFGIFSRSEYERELFDLLQANRETDHDTGPKRKERPYTYLGVFFVDGAGVPITGTLELAAFPAFFATLRGKKIPFNAYSAQMVTLFDQQASNLRERRDGGPPLPMDDGFIATLLGEITKLLDWTPGGLKRAPRLIVLTRYLKKPDQVWQLPPVNGFFHEDITAVLAAVQSGGDLGLLENYLSELSASQRIDLDRLDNLKPILSASRLPAGRWPSEFPMALMQQVAVNAARPHLGQGGIFSVNGPPGTGKTTLLMDMIAANVAERAELLCEYGQPEDAFEQKWDVKFPGRTSPSPVFALDEALLDFVMVVASSNNGAVENITKELPDEEKIGERFRTTTRYLDACASVLLNGAEEQNEPEEDFEGDEVMSSGKAERDDSRIKVWGLMSAALGSKDNRTKLVQTLNAKIPDPEDPEGKKTIPAPHNIFEQIWETGRPLRWSRVRADFRRLLTEVRDEQERITKIETMRRTVADLELALAQTKRAIADLEIARSQALTKNEETTKTLTKAKELFDFADKSATLMAAAKPGPLSVLFAILWRLLLLALGVKRELSANWETRYSSALEERKRHFEAYGTAKIGWNDAATEAKRVESALDKANSDLASASAALRAEESALAKALKELPGLIEFHQLAAQEERDRQQTLPNTTDRLTRLRAELFSEAMRVHLAFIAAAKGKFKANLMRAFDMLSGDPAIGDAIAKGAAPHLWATLCLAVPVVSTTFASIARCFGNVGAGKIGWLFIDEAGQAVPQHAVGALWRAKRAMVVGDPFQVDPVITLDRNIDRKLLERHSVPKRFMATASSAQTLADASNPFGATRKTYRDDDVWVGSPLKVHRRCVDPMFSLSNDIAYNNSMVLADGKTEGEISLSETRPLLGPSQWFDVKGMDDNLKHFIPAQAEIACEIVNAYATNEWLDRKGLPALFVISPFRSMADGLEDLLRNRRDEWAPGRSDAEVDAWLNASVGTVHTFQGKECETVVFVLGGETKGAIEWAARTPNIINVAATRAKRRLYVIGDRDRWTQFNLGRRLAALPDAPDYFWLNGALFEEDEDDAGDWNIRHISLETRGGGDSDEEREMRDMERVLRILEFEPWLRAVTKIYSNSKVGEFWIDVSSSDYEFLKEAADSFSQAFIQAAGGHNGICVHGENSKTAYASADWPEEDE